MEIKPQNLTQANKAAFPDIVWDPPRPERLRPALLADVIVIVNYLRRHHPAAHRVRVCWKGNSFRRQELVSAEVLP